MAYLTKQKQEYIDQIIEQIQLDTGLFYPENNLLDIADKLGVKVYETELPRRNMKGIVDWKKDGTAIIYINKNDTPEKKTFSVAHELGHFKLHPNRNKLRIDTLDYSKDTKSIQEESEANYFAASLLVPKHRLLKLLQITHDKDKIAKYFGVSRSVIENRIKWIECN
jgi:Zn-dependent peptidase ImmA (M78 family)